MANVRARGALKDAKSTPKRKRGSLAVGLVLVAVAADGKRRLKDELLKALRGQVPIVEAENFYLTEFPVQM